MKTVLKWIAVGAAIVLALGTIAYAALSIYDPGLAWVKPGVAQRKTPPGVASAIVVENVTVLPMDDERVLEAQTVVVKDGRVTGIGPDGQVEIPAGAHAVDGEGRFSSRV
jgi:hypothetical protein